MSTELQAPLPWVQEALPPRKWSSHLCQGMVERLSAQVQSLGRGHIHIAALTSSLSFPAESKPALTESAPEVSVPCLLQCLLSLKKAWICSGAKQNTLCMRALIDVHVPPTTPSALTRFAFQAVEYIDKAALI